MAYIRRTSMVAAVVAAVSLVPMLVLGDTRAVADDRPAMRLDVHQGTLVIDAVDASVPEILAHLSRRLDVEVRGAAPSDRRITRKITGSFSEVLATLLRGANYVVTTHRGRRRLVLYPAGGLPSQPPPVAVAVRTAPAGLDPTPEKKLRRQRAELVALSTRYKTMSAKVAAKNPWYAEKLTAQAASLLRRAEAIGQQLAR